jgi:zinc transporter 1/2/3
VFLYIEKLAFRNVHKRASEHMSAEDIAAEASKTNSITPYILQVAIGLHAIFEGLAIGIEEHRSDCLGICMLDHM